MRKDQVSEIFFPPVEESTRDTGLRFTDVLFGFVISQIFLRLQHWASISSFNRWQLICSTVLLLGSWIGFRRSLNRPEYELKFFNLPLLRFLLDQVMLILYFRAATLTPEEPGETINDMSTAQATIEALLIVFVLYFLWDGVGQLMAATKYGQIKRSNWPPFITLVFLVVIGILFWVVQTVDDFDPTRILILATAALVLYRWAKEINTTIQTKARAGEDP